MAVLIDCVDIKNKILEDLNLELHDIQDDICLGIIQVEGDPASSTYVRNKHRLCEQLGIRSLVVKLPERTTQAELERVIQSLANDSTVHGLMLQLPLPIGLNAQRAIDLIPHKKDVDGLTTTSQGMLFTNQLEESLQPCTPLGVLEIFKHLNVDLTGKHVVVIGRSQLFGNSMAQLLMRQNATVTLCHSRTKDLKSITKQADIVISAIGSPQFIDHTFFNGKTEYVIDVGMSLVDGVLVGDVYVETLKHVVKYATPTPRGTGQITVPMLLKNTIKAYQLQQQEARR